MHSTVNGESTPDIIFINFKLYADEVFIARGHKILPVIGGARTKPHANMDETAWSKRERPRRVQGRVEECIAYGLYPINIFNFNWLFKRC